MSEFEGILSQVMSFDLEAFEARMKASRDAREALRLQAQHSTGQVQLTISQLMQKIHGGEETPADNSPTLQVKTEGAPNEQPRPADAGFPAPPTGPVGPRRG